MLDVQPMTKHAKDQNEILKLRQIIGSSSNGVVVLDTSGIVSCCNEKASSLLGITGDDIIGKNLHMVFEQNSPLIDIVDQFDKVEKVTLSLNGNDLLLDFIPFDIEGIVHGGTMILHDLSTFEGVLRELKTNSLISERLDSIVEYSYDGIYITDGEANTLRINEAYERITGLKREDMMHRNTKALVEDGYISRSGSLLAIAQRKTISLNQTFKTGKKALITSKPIFDEQQNIVMVVTNVRDITELYTLKNQLEAQALLTEKYYNEAKALKAQWLDTSDLIVEDKSMLDLLYSAQKIAVTDVTVHISGESGVGKEVIAKFIHNNSNRADSHFIKINCGAIPENLIEAELFGYERGAYTGAGKDGKPGLFELADKGTLFLDEIGELPLNMQVKLLRVLQEGEFLRVGGIRPIRVDVRIISATNKRLEKLVANAQFREDLFYRLNVIPIFIPPLRERKDDIIKLINHFLSSINQKYHYQRTIDRDALDALVEYPWPGNIRELKNVIDRIAVMSPQDCIQSENLPNFIFSKKYKLKASQETMTLKDAIVEIEGELISQAFEKYGNVRDAAKVLGIDASTLVRKRKRFLDTQK